ncbi:hypothetical protein S245_061077 [Arachis hypogaea]
MALDNKIQWLLLPTPPPQGVAYCRRPSVYLASVVLQAFNPCSLSPIAAASLSSASVVFVCSAALPPPFLRRSRSPLRSAAVFLRVLRRSRSLGVHRSRSLAVHRSPFEFAFAFVWKPRCSASNSVTNPRALPSRRTALFCRRREFPKPATNTLLQTLQLLISITNLQ